MDAANDEMGTIAGINILDDEEMGRIADSEATVERTLEHELSTMMINPPDPSSISPSCRLPPELSQRPWSQTHLRVRYWCLSL